MPVSLIAGDLFDDPAEAYVNPVNCVGVMGAGLALQFKKRYPRYFQDYADCCRGGMVKPGRIHVHSTREEHPRYILSFPTKRHWRDRSRLADIEAGLRSLRQALIDNGIRSVAVPALGAGLGGLDWDRVGARITKALGDLDGVKVRVFEPLALRSEAAPGSQPLL